MEGEEAREFVLSYECRPGEAFLVVGVVAGGGIRPGYFPDSGEDDIVVVLFAPEKRHQLETVFGDDVHVAHLGHYGLLGGADGPNG